ncbi:MAG: ankyrin repeat domain-containing protein [Syntrophotaleaceae bacterium]
MRKLFGLVYLGLNAALLATVAILAAQSQVSASQGAGWPWLLPPAFGMLCGYGLYRGWVGRVRGLLIALSLLISAGAILIPLLVSPRLQALEQQHQGAKLLEANENTQRFFDALLAGNLALVEQLIDEGMNINTRDATGQSALHLAKERNMVQLLLQRGAETEARDDLGMTPLFNKDTVLAEMLLAAGSDLEARSDQGNTPFLWHAYSGYLEGLQFLKARGANVRACNADGKNALDIARQFQPETAACAYLETLDIPPCQ